MRKTVFDELESIFEKTELPVEDKVIFSADMEKLVREEIRKEISKIPIGALISEVISKKSDIQQERLEDLKTSIRKEIQNVEAVSKSEVSKFRPEITAIVDKLRKNFADLRNELASQPMYQFGGFVPPNPLNKSLNSVLTNVDGTWAGLDWKPGSGGGGLPPGTFTISNNTPLYTFDATGSSIDGLYQTVATLIRKLQGEI